MESQIIVPRISYDALIGVLPPSDLTNLDIDASMSRYDAMLLAEVRNWYPNAKLGNNLVCDNDEEQRDITYLAEHIFHTGEFWVTL